MQMIIKGEFTKYAGTWFYVPGGFWERRRKATLNEIDVHGLEG
tara:strand:- start:5798 stop:5926 length:129 start_codon:yes stop_codon:yes gene_type:complete